MMWSRSRLVILDESLQRLKMRRDWRHTVYLDENSMTFWFIISNGEEFSII